MTPPHKAKPPGVKRALLFRKIGTPPAGPHEMVEAEADSATSYLAGYNDADSGKTAQSG